MKPIITTALMFALLSATQGCHTIGAAAHKAEIQFIFAQRTELQRRFFTQNPKEPWRKPDTKQYVSGIKNIDVNKCPADFQNAWFGYVVALEQSHANDGKINLAELGKLLGAAAVFEVHPVAALGILGAGGDTTQKRLDQKVDDAWYSLERVSMNYGVKPER